MLKLRIVSALLLLFSTAYRASASDPGYDILIIAGQSNATNSGLGERHDPLEGLIDDRIDQLTCDDANGNLAFDPGETARVVNATDYVRDCNSGSEAAAAWILASHRTGFAISLARQVAAHALGPERRVLIVAGGVGGSGSLQWAEGSSYRTGLIARLRLARALPGRHQIVGFFWSQGEADIASVALALSNHQLAPSEVGGFLSAYRARLVDLIAAIRNEAGDDALPVLISAKAPQWTEYAEMRSAYEDADREVASAIGSSAFVASDGLTSNPLCSESPVDCEDAGHIHFSAEAHVQMGARFFQALESLR